MKTMFTKSFTQIGKHDANTAGGKGASLGEMTQAGIPVPSGFVVLADAFEQFLKETDLNVEIDSILHTVNHQEMHTVEHASERIQKLILEAKMPEDIANEIKSEFEKLGAEFVAVRSSATAEDSASAAWAGQLDSFLNTNEETLLENVQKCFASLFTPRAVFYRFEKGLHDQKISVAVVVQKMVDSEKSGIAFSVHPVTEDRNQLIIEAGFGLGEAIVSGQITPDSYVVEKRLDNEDDAKNILLSRVFSREKSLLYFSMWNDSDRLGYKHFLDYDVQNNLFIVPPRGQKGSVWYSFDEFSKIEERLKNQLTQNFETFTTLIFERLDTDWKLLLPYLNGNKIIKDGQEFEFYYNTLVHWWSAMNTVFGVPDMADASADLKTKVLSIRTESEKFTEEMNKLMISFFETSFPPYKDLSHVITPNEVVKLSADKLELDELEAVKDRLSGCFILNGVIQNLKTLEDTLKQNHLALEKIEADNATEIKGSPAFKGVIAGIVRIVHGFKDLDMVQEGDVLVTEMTNPDYVPTMKKIVAIITDEGGITCHAAITSRELKIPCIIGTKIATQVLRDGDLVEVDADNGVVRVLEKNKK